MEENKLDGGNELETLEEKDTTVTESPENDNKDSKDKKSKKDKKSGNLLSRFASRVNVYLLAFILLIVIALIIMFVVINQNNREVEKQTNIETQELTQEAIDELISNEATVGDPKQLLSVESNAVFAGKVLIRDGLDVAGPIKVGGDLSLPGITVSGTSQFDDVQVNSLSIAGDTNVQGILTVQNGITVNGQASFAGPISAPSITVDNLSINGDIQFSRHIDAGGATPGVSAGGAVGSGGTVTISGTDTAGTVTVNAGSGAGNGILANVTFRSAFSGNPHVVITPVTSNSALANANFYLISRTSSGFSIAASSFGGATGSISFDYIVID